LFSAKAEVKFKNVTIKLFTPTFKIREDVKNLFGEQEFLSTIIDKLKKGDIVWDIGASYGLYSLFIGESNSSVKVYAFEPEQRTAKLLNKNLKLNRLENIILLNYALGNFDGVANLHVSASANIGTHSLVIRDDYPVSSKGKSISIWKGDTLVNNRKVASPTVVKIDVEGAELDVLKGMENTLHQPELRLIQVEIHPKILPLFGAKVNDIYALLQRNNFHVVIEKERGSEIEVLFEK
jgi:FkbM family methyltransferase